MKLVLGTVQLGMNYGIQGHGQPSIEQALEILNTAYTAGVHTFDTASAYGTAEDVLGVFLNQPQIDKSLLKIISKFNSSIDKLEENIQICLASTGVKCLEGYMFHDAHYIFDAAAVRALERLKENNLTRKIGVSTYTPIQAMKALEYESIDIIQVPYNVFDRRLNACGFFESAKEKGVEVHARSVLLQGLLMMEPEHLPDHMTFALPYLKEFHRICDKYGVDTFSTAVKFVMYQSMIDYIVFGVDNILQLKQYISLDKKINHVLIKDLTENCVCTDDKVLMPNLWEK